MFTLCMSRGHTSKQDAHDHNSQTNKQIKGGYLLRYRRGFFCASWCEEWFVLYEDSTLAWFTDKGLSRPRGRLRIGDVPEFLAVGEWTRQVPHKPRFPRNCHIGQFLVVGSHMSHNVQWLMAQSPAEVNDWVTAISNTLPPPPHLPLENKRLSLATTTEALLHGRSCARKEPESGKGRSAAHEADHTVLSGVVIDWGHGWGWGQSAWATHTACAHEAAVSSALYCHAVEDYALGGYDEVDWSSFGDFSF